MSTDTCTTVDVLIERLQTHPEEFFDRTLVSVSGAKDIVGGTKWQRITSLLWADKPAQTNLWYDMFTSDERERFKAAFTKAVRAELDVQITNRLVNGAEFEDVAQDIAQKQAFIAAQQKAMQNIGRPSSNTAAGSAGSSGSLLGPIGYSNQQRLLDPYNVYNQLKLLEEEERAQKLAETQQERFRLADKLKSWF